MKVILIRHTSVDVPKGVCYGQTDVPLAPTFPEEAQSVKEKLSTYSFDKVYCSPLTRCVELARFCGYPDAIKDDRLKEMNFGEWEMKAYDDITDPYLQQWYDDYINVAPPAGESVLDQRLRLESFIADLKHTASPRSNIAIFTHGGILINALVAFTPATYADVYASLPPYGSVLEINIPVCRSEQRIR